MGELIANDFIKKIQHRIRSLQRLKNHRYLHSIKIIVVNFHNAISIVGSHRTCFSRSLLKSKDFVKSSAYGSISGLSMDSIS